MISAVKSLRNAVVKGSNTAFEKFKPTSEINALAETRQLIRFWLTFAVASSQAVLLVSM